MSSTVDANVLLYASDTTSPHHESSRRLLAHLARGPDLMYLFWPVAMAYLRIATHSAVFAHPLEPATAQANLEGLLSRPHVRSPGEQDGFWSVYTATVAGDVVRGNLVSDAWLVALMRHHGVATIWTTDRDFRRFPAITSRNPHDWEGRRPAQ